MSAGLKKESCYQHVSLLACYLISNPIVSCLNHFNNIISACFPKYTLFLDKKRTAIVLLSFRRRYFTMGIVKIYNVLGGFYVNYSITCHEKCLLSWCTNMHKFSIIFYAIYINLWNFPTNQSPQACHICQPAPQTALCTPLRTGISFPEPAGIFVPSTRCPGFPGSAAW